MSPLVTAPANHSVSNPNLPSLGIVKDDPAETHVCIYSPLSVNSQYIIEIWLELTPISSLTSMITS